MGSFKGSKTCKKNLRLQRRFAIHLNGRKLASRWTVALTRVGGPARSAPARAATILGGDKRVSSLKTTRHRFLVARFARDNFSTIGLVFRGYPLFGLCQPGVFSRWHFVCIRLSQSAFVSMRDGDQTKKMLAVQQASSVHGQLKSVATLWAWNINHRKSETIALNLKFDHSSNSQPGKENNVTSHPSDTAGKTKC